MIHGNENLNPPEKKKVNVQSAEHQQIIMIIVVKNAIENHFDNIFSFKVWLQ